MRKIRASLFSISLLAMTPILLVPVATGLAESVAAAPTRTPVPSDLADYPQLGPPTPTAKPSPSPSPSVRLGARSSTLPKILQDVEEKYTQAATLQADFTQINEIAALKIKKTSSGVLMVKRPDKLRWETLKPDMNLLVSDGRRFWFYTPPFDEGEHGQVIEKKSNEINSKLANALLSGRFSVGKEMKIQQESPSRFLLVPKAGTAGTVKRAEIEIDADRGLIQKVILEHKGGNRSEITLSKIQLGKKIGDDAFVFDAPPNTDKVEQ